MNLFPPLSGPPHFYPVKPQQTRTARNSIKTIAPKNPSALQIIFPHSAKLKKQTADGPQSQSAPSLRRPRCCGGCAFGPGKLGITAAVRSPNRVFPGQNRAKTADFCAQSSQNAPKRARKPSASESQSAPHQQHTRIHRNQNFSRLCSCETVRHRNPLPMTDTPETPNRLKNPQRKRISPATSRSQSDRIGIGCRAYRRARVKAARGALRHTGDGFPPGRAGGWFGFPCARSRPV